MFYISVGERGFTCTCSIPVKLTFSYVAHPVGASEYVAGFLYLGSQSDVFLPMQSCGWVMLQPCLQLELPSVDFVRQTPSI